MTFTTKPTGAPEERRRLNERVVARLRLWLAGGVLAGGHCLAEVIVPTAVLTPSSTCALTVAA